jgi:hypothetical protein
LISEGFLDGFDADGLYYNIVHWLVPAIGVNGLDGVNYLAAVGIFNFTEYGVLAK